MRINAAGFVLQQRMLLWLVYALTVIFVFAFAIRAAIDLVSYNWDWDIDHMMYYGSRLLQGELVWTREYDDKLPLVQYIFARVAYFSAIPRLIPSISRSSKRSRNNQLIDVPVLMTSLRLKPKLRIASPLLKGKRLFAATLAMRGPAHLDQVRF